MSDFDLNKKYDVVMSLFSSISYILTYRRLVGALSSFAKHWDQNGVLDVEPWLTPKIESRSLVRTVRLASLKSRGQPVTDQRFNDRDRPGIFRTKNHYSPATANPRFRVHQKFFFAKIFQKLIQITMVSIQYCIANDCRRPKIVLIEDPIVK